MKPQNHTDANDTWSPMDEVPSHMTPDERVAFWDEVRKTNIEAAFRPRDELDTLWPPLPGSLRERVLRLQDDIAEVLADVAERLLTDEAIDE